MKDTTCKEIRGLFDYYTKGRLDDGKTAIVREHLVDCEKCYDALVEFIENGIDAGNVPIIEAPYYPPKELFEMFKDYGTVLREFAAETVN